MSKVETWKWFALRVTYGREMAARKLMDSMPELILDTFIPMRYEYVFRNGRKSRKLMPAVHNLIFARSQRSILDGIKRTRIPYLRYIMHHEGETSFPLTVRTEEMENFIRVAKRVEEDIRYVSAEDFDLKAGERIRIVGGPFVGTEGILVKVKGSRSKRVVVSLDNFLHLATTTIPVNWIEKA